MGGGPRVGENFAYGVAIGNPGRLRPSPTGWGFKALKRYGKMWRLWNKMVFVEKIAESGKYWE